MLTRPGSARPRGYDHELISFHQPVTGQELTQRHPRPFEVGESYTAPGRPVRHQGAVGRFRKASVQLRFPARPRSPAGPARPVCRLRRDLGPQLPPASPRPYRLGRDLYRRPFSGAPGRRHDPRPGPAYRDELLPDHGRASAKPPRRVVIPAGANTITDGVSAAIQAAVGVTVRWFPGPDWFATSAAIRRPTTPPRRHRLPASGRVFPDAQPAPPSLVVTRARCSLIDTNALPASIATELTRLAPAADRRPGGASTVTDNVEGLAAYAAHVERWYGADRFSTSVAVTSQSYAPAWASAYVASGRVYTDALSGAPVAGMTGGLVLLTDTTKLLSITASELAPLEAQEDRGPSAAPTPSRMACRLPQRLRHPVAKAPSRPPERLRALRRAPSPRCGPQWSA